MVIAVNPSTPADLSLQRSERLALGHLPAQMKDEIASFTFVRNDLIWGERGVNTEKQRYLSNTFIFII